MLSLCACIYVFVMSVCTCLWYMGVCIHIQMISVFSTSAYCLGHGQISVMDLPFSLAVIQYLLLLHSLKDQRTRFNFPVCLQEHYPCV